MGGTKINLTLEFLDEYLVLIVDQLVYKYIGV